MCFLFSCVYKQKELENVQCPIGYYSILTLNINVLKEAWNRWAIYGSYENPPVKKNAFIDKTTFYLYGK